MIEMINVNLMVSMINLLAIGGMVFIMRAQVKGMLDMVSKFNNEKFGMNADFNRERNEWARERKELMDRVQAPSFTEYKQAEVKVIKAQKEEKEAPPIVLE